MGFASAGERAAREPSPTRWEVVGIGEHPHLNLPPIEGEEVKSEDRLPPSRKKELGVEEGIPPGHPAAVGSCFRRNDEKGGGNGFRLSPE